MNLKLISCAFAFAGVLSAQAQHVMEVKTTKLGAPVSSTMYGLFFEDINFAADGGLYGELVKNRSFEFPQSFMGWRVFGNVELKNDGPFERCPHYVVLSDPGHRERRTGLQNEGFFGIGVEKGKEYRFSVWAKAPKGKSQIRVQLINEQAMYERQNFSEVKVDVNGNEWKKYTVTIKATRTEPKANLRIFLSDGNPVALEHVSLFPADTYKGRKNGLRRDLAQALEDMHPGVFRFPGGCIVEGTTLDSRYQWKNTVGPVENRPLNRNRWEDTFDYRYYADYYQSYGLGFFEFFQLCEDIKAEPLPVLSVGLACQFQNGEKAHAKMDELQPFIDDCLDLIEFANGPVDSKWGKVRADMGHPEPFNMKYIGIGNEQWDTPYFERLKPFVAAVRAKYPNIKIVGTSGPDSEGKMFEKGWVAMKEQKADLVDEHFYRNIDWFKNQMNRYDEYDRKGPKVFAGEYACHDKGKKYNHAGASIYEAAFMLNLEKNADVVHMATYAPLFAHVKGWQWRPDAIWYDNLRSARTASYWVQALFSQNKGTNVLTTSLSNPTPKGEDGVFAQACLDSKKGEYIVKVVNTQEKAESVRIDLKGVKKIGAVKAITLDLSDYDLENTVDNPNAITPQESAIKADGTSINLTVPAKNFIVIIANK